MGTVFGKIIRGELPAEKVYEDDKIVAFKDINPAAPVHILIVPKKEIPDLQSLEEADYSLLQDVVRVAQDLARRYDISEGYRLVTNNGPQAGQAVFHLHFHLIGGKTLGPIA
jgi:histidine triad (HIT) family protein